MYLAESR